MLSHCRRRRLSGYKSVSISVSSIRRIRGWSWSLAVVLSATAIDADVPQFERDVRPIFREYCFDCHGAREDLEGGLDLRLVRFLQRGGESGPSIVPGNPDDSYLIARLQSGEMPPGETRVPDETIDVIRRWIAAGSPTLRPEPESIGPGIPISLEERAYWAYQPIKRPSVPELGDSSRIRTPIDWMLQQAMPEGLSFSPDADRETLILRCYLDLIGLPPTEDELERFRSLPDGDWYEALVTTLLNSPHYGERWARHWLDVAGYADSEGATVSDADRPWVWKYRDYVIRSFNDDKPFDRFITEQIAGDELAGPKQGDWTAVQIELLTATGFLRLAADGTGSGDNSPDARNKVIADTLKIIGNSLLGMSLNCAQCHDHRYDPISQTDYYAVRSVFEPALDWQNWKTPAQRRVSLHTAADRERAAQVEQEAQAVIKERDARQAEYMRQALDQELKKYDEQLRKTLREAYDTPADQRSAKQTALLKANPSVNITPGVLYQYIPESKTELQKFADRISEIRKKKPKEEFLRVLTESAGHAPIARLFHRGEHAQPKQEIIPAAITVAAPSGNRTEFPTNDPDYPTSGRRLAFAQWLTSRDNPLVARTIVNRVWMHHFGRGLVTTPGDFGKLGVEPTHPILLDWLAAEFIDSGWSLKHLHRLILTSTAWRQSSDRDDARDSIDPENRFYWRKSLVRLEAETIRDRMLSASGQLDRTLYGPPVGVKEDDTGQVIVDGFQVRRSLYVRVRRSQPVAMMQSFDAPVMEVNCESRPVSTVATQSLMLLNGRFTLDQAGHLAERCISEARPLSDAELSSLPELPKLDSGPWSFGFARLNQDSQTTEEFKPLPYWNGSEWQGGPERPDPKIGWVILNAGGGHPGGQFAAIRRWTAPADGDVQISGSLGHSSENGDGVRGRIVIRERELLGDWSIHHGSVETDCDRTTVMAGESVDFVVDARTHETSDSFTWRARVVLMRTDGSSETCESQSQFHGPTPDVSLLPPQITRAWQLALCRDPSPEELHMAVAFAAEQLCTIQSENRGVAEGETPTSQVLVNVCQMLLNSNEFLYVE